jgi:purine-binding chemotaxis protein CheW
MKRSAQNRREAIDWQAGRAYVARAAVLMDEALSPSPQRIRAIMDQRARALALVPQQSQAPRDERDAVLFLLGGERYAIETVFVREVIRAAHLTRVPKGADLFPHVTNLRGEILGVIDLHKLLELPSAPPAQLPWLIVLGRTRAEFAIPVEAVEQIRRVRAARRPNAAGWSERPKSPFVGGIAADALILLDGPALLDDRRLYAGRPDAMRDPMREGVVP